MSDLKLLPCPFCGGHASQPETTSSSDERCGYNFVAYVECSACGVSTRTGSHHDKNGWCNESTESAKARAVVKWNTRTQPEATAPPPELMGYWYWDEGGLRDAPEWRMGGIKRPPADWPKNKRLNLYAGAQAQDLSAAILGLPLPEMEYIGSGGNLGYTEVKMRDLLKAAAALASSANSLSARDSEKALDALLTRIGDAFEAYERYGAICEFEGNPMIYADTLTEIVTLRGEYHAILQSQKNGAT